MNGQPPPPPPPSFSPQPVPPPKKGLSPLAWIGIGCGALAVLAVIGFSVMLVAGGWFIKKQAEKIEKNPMVVAEWFLRANPDLEVVSTDEDAGTITVKNIKTGEVMTLNAKDIKEGRLEVKTEDGTAVLDASAQDGATIKVTDEKGQISTLQAGSGAAPQNLPSWLPVYPGSTVQGTFDANTAEDRSVSFSLTTPDAGDKVLAFYESRLKDAGLKVDLTATSSTTEGSGGLLTASSENPSRNVNVLVAASEGGQTTATITFAEKQ